MANTPEKSSAENEGKPRLRLPFDNRPKDIGTWSYIHRRGIYITLIAYLLFAIVFISTRITLGDRSYNDTIIIDFGQEEQPQPQEDIIKPLEHIEDYSDIMNRISNENAELNAQIRDAAGTNASELYSDADALSDKMRSNREAYEQGLRREQELIDASRRDNGSEQTAQDTKVQGRVTVSFSFTNPGRTSSRLIVPAYMCEGGGQVVVSVVANNNGDIISATVDRSRSSGDDCMRTTALNAARGSRFNLDPGAPASHRGTITYLFIPQ